MAKQDRTPLVESAEEFDDQLATYARLGELFLKTPLGSVKHLERANQTLQEIASCEERLQAAGKALVLALTGAREHQEQLAQSVIAHVPTLQARNSRLHELMTELTALAGEVGGLNAAIQARAGNGDAAATPTSADAQDLSQTILALSQRAEALAKSANDSELEELGTQAHTLHQRLQAIGKKLAKASS